MTTIQTLRISKYGPQPVLVEWESRSPINIRFHAGIVWPEIEGTDGGFEVLAQFSIPAIGADAADEFGTVCREAAHLKAMLRASELVLQTNHPVDRVVVESLDTSTFRAMRSLGKYRALRELANTAGGDIHDSRRRHPRFSRDSCTGRVQRFDAEENLGEQTGEETKTAPADCSVGAAWIAIFDPCRAVGRDQCSHRLRWSSLSSLHRLWHGLL